MQLYSSKFKVTSLSCTLLSTQAAEKSSQSVVGNSVWFFWSILLEFSLPFSRKLLLSFRQLGGTCLGLE